MLVKTLRKTLLKTIAIGEIDQAQLWIQEGHVRI